MILAVIATREGTVSILRLEELIEKFAVPDTLEGRDAHDIMRGVLQTAVAARTALQASVLAVLRASPAEVAWNPKALHLAHLD